LRIPFPSRRFSKVIEVCDVAIEVVPGHSKCKEFGKCVFPFRSVGEG
jgi:hypothetical protein